MSININDFLHALPNKVNPDVLEGQNACFHFDFEAAGTYTVQLTDGKLDVLNGLHGTPSCTVKTTEEAFNKLLSGDLNPMMAMMTGKLKISNPGEMMKYAKIFGLM
jgi:putative sterol carrier protein